MRHRARSHAWRSYVSMGLIILASGCDSDETPAARPATGDGGSGVTQESGTVPLNADDVCNASLAHEKACKREVEPDFLQSCKSLFACQTNIMEPARVGAFWTCANSLKCEYSDDSCIAPDGEGLDPAGQKAMDDCMAKHASCIRADGSRPFLDDDCLGLAVGKAEVRVKLGACVLKACDEIAPCLEQVFGSYGCKDD